MAEQQVWVELVVVETRLTQAVLLQVMAQLIPAAEEVVVAQLHLQLLAQAAQAALALSSSVTQPQIKACLYLTLLSNGLLRSA